MKFKSVLPWLCVVGLLAGLGALYAARLSQQSELDQLRGEVQSLRAASEDSKPAQGQTENEELARLRKENEELLRLRAEVRQLRDEKQGLAKQLQTAQGQVQNAQAQAQAARSTATPPPLTEQAAAQAYRALYGQQPTTPDQDKASFCINNLRQIEAAKQQWASQNKKGADAVPSAADLAPFLQGNVMPACPAGGAYSFNAVGSPATCNIPGHVLPK
jgi:hypothetical protein